MHSVFALTLMMTSLACSIPIPADKLQLDATEQVSLQKRAREQAQWKKGKDKNIAGADVRGVTVCRSKTGGQWHSGYVAEGKCHYSYGGKEVTSDDFQVLKSGKMYGWATGTFYLFLITILSLDLKMEPRLLLLIIMEDMRFLFAERTVSRARSGVETAVMEQEARKNAMEALRSWSRLENSSINFPLFIVFLYLSFNFKGSIIHVKW